MTTLLFHLRDIDGIVHEAHLARTKDHGTVPCLRLRATSILIDRSDIIRANHMEPSCWRTLRRDGRDYIDYLETIDEVTCLICLGLSLS